MFLLIGRENAFVMNPENAFIDVYGKEMKVYRYGKELVCANAGTSHAQTINFITWNNGIFQNKETNRKRRGMLEGRTTSRSQSIVSTAPNFN